MLRRAVALYMVFVLTAGQSLCCCSAMSLSARSTPPVAGSECPAQPVRSCCCPERCEANGTPASSGHTGATGDQQPGEKPGKHQCPCQGKHKPQATAGESAAVGSAVQQAARLLALGFEFVAVTSGFDGPQQPAPDTGGGTSPPGHRLVARQLLDLHHLLRC